MSKPSRLASEFPSLLKFPSFPPPPSKLLTDGSHGVQQVPADRSPPQARPGRPHGLSQTEHGRRDARVRRGDGPDGLVGGLGEPGEMGPGDVEGWGPRDAVDALALASHRESFVRVCVPGQKRKEREKKLGPGAASTRKNKKSKVIERRKKEREREPLDLDSCTLLPAGGKALPTPVPSFIPSFSRREREKEKRAVPTQEKEEKKADSFCCFCSLQKNNVKKKTRLLSTSLSFSLSLSFFTWAPDRLARGPPRRPPGP